MDYWKEKIAVVTGGSSGLGKAIALCLAQQTYGRGETRRKTTFVRQPFSGASEPVSEERLLGADKMVSTAICHGQRQISRNRQGIDNQARGKDWSGGGYAVVDRPTIILKLRAH